jgi:hypothetical protein
MNKNPYQQYLKELVVMLVYLAGQAKHKSEDKRWPFDRGMLFAYADLLDRMQRKAILQDIDLSAVGLNKVKPLQDFLGIKD